MSCAGSRDVVQLFRIMLFSSNWSIWSGAQRDPFFIFSYVVHGKVVTSEQREEGMKLIDSAALLPKHAYPPNPAILGVFRPDSADPKALIFLTWSKGMVNMRHISQLGFPRSK